MFAHLRSLTNSPTSARDLSQILSPVRLGLWFTVFNLAVIIAFVSLYFIVDEIGNYSSARSGFDDVLFGSLELGQMFACVLFITVAIFLTFFVPFRIFGFVIGPRTLRYLDQIVISGISPARYMAGKVILQNFFLLVVLAAALPYLVLCFVLGGVSIPFVLGSIFALWLYTNLLSLVSLAASIVASEIVAIPATILVFGIILYAGFLPIPPHLLNFSPIPVFTAPAYQFLLQQDSALNSSWLDIYASSTLFGSLLGTHLLYYAITISILSAFLFLFLSIGPLTSISGSGPLSNFGSIVMPGDSKKKRIFRGQLLLRRRGELAFFYENRSARLHSLDLPLRWGAKEIIFLALLASSVLYLHVMIPAISKPDFYATTLFIGLAFPVLNIFLFTRDGTTANLHYPKHSAAEADNFFFFLNATLIFGFVFVMPFVRETWFTPLAFRSYSFYNQPIFDSLPGSFVLMGAIISVASVAIYALVQWLATRMWSHLHAYLTALFLYSLSLTVPFLIHAALASTYRDRTSTTVEFYHHIATLSPITPVAHLIGESAVRLPFEPSILPTLTVHLLAAAFFFFLAFKKRSRLPKTTPS